MTSVIKRHLGVSSACLVAARFANSLISLTPTLDPLNIAIRSRFLPITFDSLG